VGRNSDGLFSLAAIAERRHHVEAKFGLLRGYLLDVSGCGASLVLRSDFGEVFYFSM